MSLTGLRDALQTLADAGKALPIGADTLTAAGLTPRAGLDGALRGALLLDGDLQVTFTGTVPAASDTELDLTGTASVLGASGAVAKVAVVQQTDGTADVRLGIEPVGDWRLGTAFPVLRGEPFRELALGTPAYVVTTGPTGTYHWNGSDRGLSTGAQLFSTVTLDGPLAVVVALLEGASKRDSAELCGSVDPTDPTGKAGPVPALTLSAALSHGIGIPDLELTAPRIEVTTLVDDTGRRLAWLAFATTVRIDDTDLFQLKASIASDQTSVTFSLVPLPPPQPQITPDQIIALIGGEDYRTLVPAEVQHLFDAVALKGLVAVIGVAKLEIRSVSAAIGSNGTWGPWGPANAEIDELTLQLTVVSPFEKPSRTLFTFDATAKMLPEVFGDGEFDVELAYDMTSSDLTLAAGFAGTMGVNHLITAISGGAVDVPSDWLSLSFSDFGVTFDKPGDSAATYTLYGKADAGFPMPFLGVHVDTELQAYVSSAQSAYQLIGTLTLGGSVFQAEADFVKGDTKLTAGWAARTPKHALGIGTIVTAIGLPAPAAPPADLDLALDKADMTYDTGKSTLVLEAHSANYGEAVFAAISQPAPTKYFAGVKVDKKIDLVDLPLLASALGRSSQVAIDGIQIMLSSPLTATDAGTLASFIDPAYPHPPSDGMSGLALAMTLDIGSYKVPLSLVVPPPKQQQASGATLAAPPAVLAPPVAGSQALVATGANAAPPAPPAPTDGTVWFNLQKSFGPVSFQKVGIRYRDERLWALMNASLSAGGLTISVFGLGAGSKLDSFSPAFTIDGLGVSMEEGPVELSGALLGTIDPINFYGELLVGVEDFKLGALAGFAEVEGHPSLFGYVVVDAPLGGPPYFFVTGLAGGVGFNRELIIPGVSGVQDFPLVQWATGSGNPPSSASGGDVGTRVTQVVERLSQVVAPSVGEYWLAAGIRFTTFKVLDCFALLTVKFGTEFEVALLGLATVQIPPAPSPAVAEAQLALEASFAPSTGLIAIGGQLTPASFVLSRDCHLTGGFAFWTWVSGDHEGDVVVTLGGYSPRFTPPDYYPTVPRLGLSWQLDALSISGGLYFALTSSAVMAGGSLSATWSKGSISAWFTVEADFLIVFEPFHYYISAGIQLGASFSIDLWLTTLHVSVHVGVDIEIWGPEFAGKATVDLSLISFTIDFGDQSGKQTDTTIAWSDFVARTLPHTTPPPATGPQRALAATASDPEPAIVQILVAGGMLKQLDGSGGIDFIADGERLSLVTRSAIPAKTFSASTNVTVQGADGVAQDFGVGPVGTDSATFQPNHDVRVASGTGSLFVATPDRRSAPKALWEKRSFDGHGVVQGVDPLNDTTISGVATGLQLVPHAPDPDHTRPIALEQLLYTEDENIQRWAWSASAGPTSDPFSGQTVWDTIQAPLAQGNRSALVAELAAEGLAVPTAIAVDELATEAAFDLLEQPTLRLLGEQR